MRRLIFIYMLLLLFFITPPLYAQRSYSDFERGLNLTDDQRMKAEDMKQKYIRDWRSMKEESARKRIELRELQRDPHGNRERIDRTQRDLSNIDRSRDRSYRQYRSELGRVLDERQRQQYNNFTEGERRQRISPYRQREYGAGRTGPGYYGERRPELRGGPEPRDYRQRREPAGRYGPRPDMRGYDRRGWDMRGHGR